MASLAPENREYIEYLDNYEFSQVDGALLMSFLDDTQVIEDCDDERLTSVMRSLEAEIDIHVAADEKNSFQKDHSTWCSNINSFDRKSKEGMESSSSNMLDFNWTEMEMEMETETEEAIASIPNELIANWYMDAASHEQVVGGGIDHGFGNIDQRDHFQPSNYGISFEDHDHGSYGNLWQETNYASMVHG